MSNGNRQQADQRGEHFLAPNMAPSAPVSRQGRKAGQQRANAPGRSTRAKWLDGLIANFAMLLVATAIGLALYVEHNFGALISVGISALAFITFRLVHGLLAYDRRLKKMRSGLTASSRRREFGAKETSDLSALTQPSVEADDKMQAVINPEINHVLPVPVPEPATREPRQSNLIATSLAGFRPKKAPELGVPKLETLSDLDQAALFPELDTPKDLDPSKDLVDQIARELSEIRPGYDQLPVDSLTRDLENATMNLERSLAREAIMVSDALDPADFISDKSADLSADQTADQSDDQSDEEPARATELPATELSAAESPAIGLPAIELPATKLPEAVEVEQQQPLAAQKKSEPKPEPSASADPVKSESVDETVDANDVVDADDADEIGLRNVVSEAIASCRTQIYLQPILGLATRKAESFEVLTHLEDGRGAVLAPGEYLEEAERAGQMPVIDDAMLKRTIGVLRKLQSTNSPGTMFCNLSIFSLSDDGLMNTLIKVLEQEKAIAHRLVIELSEQAYLACTPNDHDKLNALRDLGVRLSLDQIKDAGIFMDALRSQLFSFIKLEAAFFLDRLGSGEDVLLPAEILSEASLAGVELIVDQIDTDTDLERVIEFGAKFGQGHIFSHPRPVKKELLEDAA